MRAKAEIIDRLNLKNAGTGLSCLCPDLSRVYLSLKFPPIHPPEGAGRRLHQTGLCSLPGSQSPVPRRALMTTYPTKLANSITNTDNNTNQQLESGAVTPSHGGTVLAGHEFDLPIAQADQQRYLDKKSSSSSSNKTTMPTSPPVARSASQARDQLQPLPSAVPRTGASSRPRPVSMPPQPYNTTAVAAPPPSEKERPVEEPPRQRTHRDGSTSKSRSSNRILGDYTLSKTLGAGSMGKVKLATHNITGEKVSITAHVYSMCH